MYLTKEAIEEAINKNELVIRPLLAASQVNNVSVDLRLGCDFLVSIQGSEPYVDATLEYNSLGNINHCFQEARRQLGDTFILHPNQTVLAVSLEYIKLSNNLLALINMRSSYARLGISLSSSIEPGYCGCISLELTNTSKVPIKLTVGACMFQIRFALISESQFYNSRKRKYLCQVRPKLSNFYKDADLKILKGISDMHNSKSVH